MGKYLLCLLGYAYFTFFNFLIFILFLFCFKCLTGDIHLYIEYIRAGCKISWDHRVCPPCFCINGTIPLYKQQLCQGKSVSSSQPTGWCDKYWLIYMYNMHFTWNSISETVYCVNSRAIHWANNDFNLWGHLLWLSHTQLQIHYHTRKMYPFRDSLIKL